MLKIQLIVERIQIGFMDEVLALSQRFFNFMISVMRLRLIHPRKLTRKREHLFCDYFALTSHHENVLYDLFFSFAIIFA
jgi:hypothetical protein